VSNLCGTRGDSIQIHSCTVHGECSLFRYCQQQTVKTCLTCVEFTSNDLSHMTDSDTGEKAESKTSRTAKTE
jgi:hypothetical protein